MPRGAAPGERRGGRAKGTRNKATVERLKREEIREQIEREIAATTKASTEQSQRRAKDRMEEFLPLLAGYAAYFQPTYPGMPQQNPNGNETAFKSWFGMFLDVAKALAPYQSPTFKATAVTVSMPNADAPAALPRPTGENVIDLTDQNAIAQNYRRIVSARKA